MGQPYPGTDSEVGLNIKEDAEFCFSLCWPWPTCGTASLLSSAAPITGGSHLKSRQQNPEELKGSVLFIKQMKRKSQSLP